MIKFEPVDRDLMVEDNIKLLLLKHTGEEILAYVFQDEGEHKNHPRHYYIFNPVKIISSVNPLTGMAQYMMSEWISQRLTSDDGFEVRTTDVLVIAEVEAKMRKSYVEFCDKVNSFKTTVKEEGLNFNMNNDDSMKNVLNQLFGNDEDEYVNSDYEEILSSLKSKKSKKLLN